MTGIWCPSLLLLLSVAQPAYFYNLRSGGRNVKTTSEYYYVYVGTLNTAVTYSRTCTKPCVAHFMWCWKKETTCKTVTNYKYVVSYRRELRSKPVYSCYSGWLPSGDGECAKPYCSGNCRNGGICTSPNHCQCASGWTDSRCRIDIDECKYRYKNSCSYKPGCINTPGSYRCICSTGYYLMPDQRSCKDIDECQYRYKNSCSYKPGCINTAGSYRCECRTGYYLMPDQRSCRDIDECDPSNGVVHGCQQKCNNLPGSYRCSCYKGYHLANYNRKDCPDDDECLSNNHGCKQVCQNYIGGYICACRSGYRLNKINHKSCDDMDECSEKISGCAHKCHNEIGSFRCSCNKGYRLRKDLKSCTAGFIYEPVDNRLHYSVLF